MKFSFNRMRFLCISFAVILSLIVFKTPVHAVVSYSSINENEVVLAQTITYLVNESKEFSRIKTIQFTAPKTATYTVTVSTSAEAHVSLSGGTGSNNSFYQGLNHSTYQQRCSFVAGRTYTLQFIPISPGTQLYVAMVYQTFQ